MLGQPMQARLAAFDEIPIVDISGAADPKRRADLVRDVVSVAERVGFMYVVGHGVGDDTFDRVFDMSRRFFDLPESEKRKIHITRSPQYRGYLGLLEKGDTDPTFKGNNLEAFHCAAELGPEHPDVTMGLPLRGPNLWPDAVEGFRDTIHTYYQRTFQVGTTLLELFAEGLDRPRDFFTRHYRHSLAQLRLLRYAQIDDPRVELLARSHCDSGVITLLSQDDTGGLQVLNKAGQWIDAPPLKGAYIINIGNTLQFWTKGRFSSTNHRVANRGGVPRFSMPFFMTPDYETIVRPIGSENDPTAPAFHVGDEMLATYRRVWPSATR
ncbi:MAG TPA: 2-oxoglutarate and iron-dependent oxygenase domain-containing protein [Stellaceae bacterium]|nr:2-oxoglutarate and iron-dependent oxygenase domain-containing protein [Stellaceae bacterium]